MRHIPLGSSTVDLTFTRQGSEWLVTSRRRSVHLASHSAQAKVTGNTLHIPAPPVEVSIPAGLPMPGAQTEQMKVLDEQRTPHSLTLTLSAPGSSTQTFSLRENTPRLHLTIDHWHRRLRARRPAPCHGPVPRRNRVRDPNGYFFLVASRRNS